ncbi:UNVERIFIED_ORG: HAMP domain-containing histidine kinase [Bacillus sp. AZ43]
MSRSRRGGLALRLLAAQLLVVAAAAAAAGLAAIAVGPPIFRTHLGQDAHVADPGSAAAHAEQAFRDAGAISLAVALLAALVAATAVSAFVTRRITRPTQALAAAAAGVSAGRYDVDLPAPALGAEFDTLTSAFGTMAAQLRRVEVTRRRLLADLAHEMRTPVATLDGYLEGLEDGVAAWDTDTAAMLRAQTRRLARLAEDITAVSKAEEGRLDLRPVTTNPGHLIDAAVAAAAERYAQRGVTLTSDIAPGLPTVTVDPDRIGQVLGNLLDNALRHTPPGGQVHLRALATAGEVSLEVVDTGPGIPPEHLPHVFERFYRVDAARDRAHGGSGVGLAIAKALVEAHGGRISAHSTPGFGAAFTLTLPATR